MGLSLLPVSTFPEETGWCLLLVQWPKDWSTSKECNTWILIEPHQVGQHSFHPPSKSMLVYSRRFLLCRVFRGRGIFFLWVESCGPKSTDSGRQRDLAGAWLFSKAEYQGKIQGCKFAPSPLGTCTSLTSKRVNVTRNLDSKLLYL